MKLPFRQNLIDLIVIENSAALGRQFTFFNLFIYFLLIENEVQIFDFYFADWVLLGYGFLTFHNFDGLFHRVDFVGGDPPLVLSFPEFSQDFLFAFTVHVEFPSHFAKIGVPPLTQRPDPILAK
jgi:hypothetical protein